MGYLLAHCILQCEVPQPRTYLKRCLAHSQSSRCLPVYFLAWLKIEEPIRTLLVSDMLLPIFLILCQQISAGTNNRSDTAAVLSPGFLHRAGRKQGVRFICLCPCAVSLLCAVLLANGEQQTDNGRRRTVVHWNLPLIIRLPRRVIADLVLASC